MHYARKRKYGGPGPIGMIGKRAPLEERFVNNVQIYGPIPEQNPELGACSIWMGYVHSSGFGAIGTGHRLLYAHRYAWERSFGRLPPKAKVRQLCGLRLCVRLDHLTLE